MIESDTPVTVTIADLRALGYCAAGCRRFVSDQGLNWPEFLKHGVESTIAEQIDDEMVRAAIAQARKRVETERT